MVTSVPITRSHVVSIPQGIDLLDTPTLNKGIALMTWSSPLPATTSNFDGNDHSVAFAGSQGNFQLNVYKPVILHNLLTSIEHVAKASRSFCERWAVGIEPNKKRIKEHLDNSLMLVTALNPHVGYGKAPQMSLTAYRDDLSLREAALKLGLLTAEQFDSWVRPEDTTHPLGGKQ